MLLPLVVFAFVTALVLLVYFASRRALHAQAGEQLERRIREVSSREVFDGESTVIQHQTAGPLPAIDRLFNVRANQDGLARLIEQSGVPTSPSAVVLMSVGTAVVAGILALLMMPAIFAAAVAVAGALAPWVWLRRCRSVRMKKFEEQFPEALDLLARALRAGHALQTAIGMVADELPAPVGVEFKKSFDQQNFGLPLKDTLTELGERVPILDVKFFVTAVSIQRETGGNLAEILDNLASVVRERFKILRQVRVHTAHGRFTGYVLLALPAALAVALSFISPDHMRALFTERMGQMMLLGALVMQTVGYVWIRQVIKIEV